MYYALTTKLTKIEETWWTSIEWQLFLQYICASCTLIIRMDGHRSEEKGITNICIMCGSVHFALAIDAYEKFNKMFL